MPPLRTGRPARSLSFWLALSLCVAAVGFALAPPSARAQGEAASPDIAASAGIFPVLLGDPAYSVFEKAVLVLALLVAIGSLVYAYLLGRQVVAAGQGTSRMREIATAVREGADAYLRRQLTTVAVLVVVIFAVLVLTKWPWAAASDSAGDRTQLAVGRGIAFLFGAIFSATVGFLGMRLATAGNLRVAAAARRSFGESLRLGYQTGTVTGLLTDGLGLLGGVVILLYFGSASYDALLGYGFGGTLLALFMRVGGGIYTKAADVGADLVGKIEKDIPEDDPRNAATIADNVGDNVGDCAGMAADVFESYQVTFVAALILGYAAFGHAGVVFPLLVRCVGIIASVVSSLAVRPGVTGNATSGMRSMNNAFRIGAAVSAAGILLCGLLYLRFEPSYVVREALNRGLAQDNESVGRLLAGKLGAERITPVARPAGPEADWTPEQRDRYTFAHAHAAAATALAWSTLEPAARAELATAVVTVPEAAGKSTELPLVEAARKVVPLWDYDLRPALACLAGLILALALNFCTEYWTSTDYSPVRGVVKASRTGHATNIIEGLAVGYESAVWAVLLIGAAILTGVLIYASTGSPLFIAFGVSMCGLGMLTLTGATLSMDVFGPVADNANGIGEMGFNRDANNRPLAATDPDYIPEAEYNSARQVLADLDAVGNTTKAITKGIAIGSAVLAAVSLFASFVAVLATGSEEGINHLSTALFKLKAADLTVASPMVFVGMLLGGAVPLLFSAMTIRAVGRAAYLIVNECRRQFRDPGIWAGTTKPDYGRVVDICTATAQRELIGPGLLAIFTPVLVGFLLGPLALGGFLAGCIVVGQLLAVFMSNAGGAWDNAKKMIEDQPRDPVRNTGKGSEAHKASVTGDTVGDPLKDTAGPAINPLIKVMNMVSLLVLPIVLTAHVGAEGGNRWLGWGLAGLAALAVAWAWWSSKQESAATRQMDAEYEQSASPTANGTPASTQEPTPAGTH